MDRRTANLLAIALLLLETLSIATVCFMKIEYLLIYPKWYLLVYSVNALSSLGAQAFFVLRLAQYRPWFRLIAFLYIAICLAYIFCLYTSRDAVTLKLVVSIYLFLYLLLALFVLWTPGWYVAIGMLASAITLILFFVIEIAGILNHRNIALLGLCTLLPNISMLFFFLQNKPSRLLPPYPTVLHD